MFGLFEKDKNKENQENIITAEFKDSTVINNIEYNSETKILTVNLKTGKSPRYANVSAEEIENMKSAESAGVFYNTKIKKTYSLIK